MLTLKEQDQIIDAVKRIITLDRARRTRVRSLTMSEKSVMAAEARDLEELRDLLKELG